MSLFDSTDAFDVQWTPPLVLVTSLLYMIAADGAVEQEELDQIWPVVRDLPYRDELVRAAIHYLRTIPPETYLSSAPRCLSDAQKIAILLNLVDVALADGHAAPREKSLFDRFLVAFNVSEERFRPFFEVLALKGDQSIFRYPDHPHNRPDYLVRIFSGST